jgi:heme exporter protein A
LRDALAQMGLAREARRPAGLLSQGQRRRVALARLFVSPAPALWLMDEPFTALDAVAADRLSARLAGHLAEGGLLVYTTHQAQDLGARPVQTLDLLDLLAPATQDAWVC